MTGTPPAPSTRHYDIDELPPLGEAIPLGIQHVLAMFASNVTLPIIIATAIGLSGGDTAFLIQVAIFVAGIATLMQTIGYGPVGARLPVVQGTSLGFVAVAIPLAERFGLAAVFGGTIFAGLVQLGMGVGLRWLRWLFPPLVSGIVVLVIGISLIPVGLTLAAGGNGAENFGSLTNLGLAALVLVVTVVLHQFTRGFTSAASVLLGIVVGYLVAIPLGLVDAQRIVDAAWFSFPEPLRFGLSLPAAALIGMGVMAVATTVETIGDLSALTMGGAGREVTDRELSGGIMGDGVGTAFAAFFGAMPNTSYSQNVGLVAVTGVMSRHVVSIGAVFLVLAGMIPKLAAVIQAMPPAVLGGAAILMFAMVAAAGIKLLVMCDLNRRNMLIAALSLGLGLGMVTAPDALAALPETLRILLETGIVPAVFVAIVLNVILPAQPDAGDGNGGAHPGVQHG